MTYRKAAQTAYNYRDSPDREAYARRAIRKHGQKFWTLAMSLLAKIEEVEAEQPDACRAAIEAEAVRRLEA